MAGFMAELLLVEIASTRIGEASYLLPFLLGVANITAIYLTLFNIKNAGERKSTTHHQSSDKKKIQKN